MIAANIVKIGLLSLAIAGILFPSTSLAGRILQEIDGAKRVPAQSSGIKDSPELARQYIKGKQYELAIDVYTKVLKESVSKSEQADLYIERARAHLKLNQYQEAWSDADLAIYKDPKNPMGFAVRGQASGLMDKLEASVADFTKAIELSPSMSQFYALRGGAYLDSGQAQKARDDFSTAIDLGKNEVNPIVFQQRAFALRKLGKYEDALLDFSESLKRDPSLVHSRLSRGALYRCLQRYKVAKLDLDVVLKENPENSEAYLQRAFVSMAQGNFKSALNDLLYADSHGMKDPYLLLSLAYSNFRLGRLSEAFNYNTRAMVEFPDQLQSAAVLQKGVLLLATGKADAASQTLSEGQSLAEQNVSIQNIADTVDDLDRLEAQHIINHNVVGEIRNRLIKTLNHLKARSGLVMHKCHDS